MPGLRQADLVARARAGVHVGVRRQRDLVRAPAHLGRRDAFLVEAVHAPRVDELVDSLGTLVICVSRSAMWMTFVPVSIASTL